MEKLQISEEEALQLIEDDKAIDKGQNLFPLTEEQEKASKKARSTGAKAPTIYKFDKKPKKENATKQNIIAGIMTAVQGLGGEIGEVPNKEREFFFFLEGKKYKIVLSMPRG